jgi:hypothetical protein
MTDNRWPSVGMRKRTMTHFWHCRQYTRLGVRKESGSSGHRLRAVWGPTFFGGGGGETRGGSSPPFGTSRNSQALRNPWHLFLFRLVLHGDSNRLRALTGQGGRGRRSGARQPEAAPPRPLAWMAAPLPNVLRSLGYPATDIPRGKAQAVESSPRHHSNDERESGPTPDSLYP